MIFDKEDYKAFDPELLNAIDAEAERQQNNIELIASENVVSKAVMAAQGTLLTNKYAEGYPGKRYYGGTDVIDVVESLAIERAKELFGAKFANVQPHSGSQANAAVYMSLIQPGDTVMGMDLSAGHLDMVHQLASLVRPITLCLTTLIKKLNSLITMLFSLKLKKYNQNSSLLGLQLTHVSLILLNSVKLLML